ncbi:MAG: type II secretion system protein [Sedimentisphaeraceae bacterium JB056]
MKKRGFTLIELLVVISIIAVLMAIMMPALTKARNQAKIVSCVANTKQIATMVSLYQADNNGKVPLMLNIWALQYCPTSSTNLSVALRDYYDFSIPSDWNPKEKYLGDNYSRVTEYYEKHIADYFVCPYSRGKSSVDTGWKTLGKEKIQNGEFQLYEMSGFMENYNTPLWQYKAGEVITSDLNAPDGVRQYGSLVWWNPGSVPNGYNARDSYDKLTEARWGRPYLKAVNAPSMAQAVAFWCSAGQFLTSTYNEQGVYNMGSHKKGSSGGTNAAFGDMHVQWVDGLRIN